MVRQAADTSLRTTRHRSVVVRSVTSKTAAQFPSTRTAFTPHVLRALPAVMSLLLSRARLLSRPAQTGARALVTRAPFATLAQGAETEEQEFSPDAAVAFEAAEPTFMTTLTFSEDGIKAMIDKDIDREKVRVTSVAAARRRTRNARGALTFHPPSSRRPLRFVLSRTDSANEP